MDKNRTYFAIDLKSFYASVECVERGLDPLGTNLLVADESRTEKTICLAVSPSLKAYGIAGRARLFEALRQVSAANNARRRSAPGQKFRGSSCIDAELKSDPSLEIGFITATPRMALYSRYSARIYDIYLRFFAPEDIHDYSIDEVFIDATDYLKVNGMTAHELARTVIKAVYAETGITATAGIGTNLYLCKVAMDIEAKKVPADEFGVRIAELDEESYRRKLWSHRPLTDFWRVGRGYAAKLEAHGMFTMGDVARCSGGKPNEYHNEELLYKLFGVNAELLIDHAWGYEPCGMSDIKAYKPSTNSISSGQVLHCPYEVPKARLIVAEMVDVLALDLVDKGLKTDQVVLTVGYDAESIKSGAYEGEVVSDRYGRDIPKHAHGSSNLPRYTSSAKLLTEVTLALFDKIVNGNLLVRRINLCAARVITEAEARKFGATEQLDLLTDYSKVEAEKLAEERETGMQKAVIGIKKKYGKNAILRGMNLQEGATTKDRNEQIGGHKA